MNLEEWRKVSALSYLNQTMARCWGRRNENSHMRHTVKSAIRYYQAVGLNQKGRTQNENLIHPGNVRLNRCGWNSFDNLRSDNNP